jgi:ACS family tartrate transporter-like MFS transporter
VEPGTAPVDEGRVLARVTRRFLPLAFICYVVAYLDRVNVGFVATELQKDLTLSATEYGLAAGLFFLGYCVFEVPSNLILERIGARRWIARIMITWGLVAMATMLVRDASTFMIARTLLGVAEAGFFPGMVLFFTYWFPASARARTGALFMMASPVAVIVGAPLSTAILRFDGIGGLRDWQWLFMLEGIPAVVLGFVVWRRLSDRPEQASWLDPHERAWLARRLAGERNLAASSAPVSWRQRIANPQLWVLCGVFFLYSIVNYGMFLWLPKLLADVTRVKGYSLSAITAVPFAAALAAMVIVGHRSDRRGERKRHFLGCLLTSAAGLIVAAAFQDQIWLLVLGFAIAQIGLRSAAGVFWALPAERLGGAAAMSIGLINAVGAIGGFAGPAMMGVLLDATGGYTGGLLALAGILVMAAALMLTL